MYGVSYKTYTINCLKCWAMGFGCMEDVVVFGARTHWWPYLNYYLSYLHKTFINGALYDPYTIDRLDYWFEQRVLDCWRKLRYFKQIKVFRVYALWCPYLNYYLSQCPFITKLAWMMHICDTDALVSSCKFLNR